MSMKKKTSKETLDKIVLATSSTSEVIELTQAQKVILAMSEKDIKEGKLISQEAMDRRNLEWLNTL